MLRDMIREAGPASKFFFFIFTAFVVFLATMLLAFLLGMAVFGASDFLSNIQSLDFASPEVIHTQKFMQAFYTIGLFIFPPLVFGYLNKEKATDFLALQHKPHGRSLVYATVLMLAAIPLVNFTYSLNQQFPFPDALEQIFKEMEDNAARITEAFLADKSTLALFVNLFLIAVLPAIGEEFFFRGIIQKQLTTWFRNTHIAVLVTAIVFSALHLQFYGFLPRFILGVVLGYLFVWSKNLWLPIAAHFVTNGFTVLATHYSKFASPEKLEKLGTLESSSLKFAFFSTMLVSVMLYAVYQTEQLKKDKEPIATED